MGKRTRLLSPQHLTSELKSDFDRDDSKVIMRRGWLFVGSFTWIGRKSCPGLFIVKTYLKPSPKMTASMYGTSR
jgi:hypothetical protein